MKKLFIAFLITYLLNVALGLAQGGTNEFNQKSPLIITDTLSGYDKINYLNNLPIITIDSSVLREIVQIKSNTDRLEKLIKDHEESRDDNTYKLKKAKQELENTKGENKKLYIYINVLKTQIEQDNNIISSLQNLAKEQKKLIENYKTNIKQQSQKIYSFNLNKYKERLKVYEQELFTIDTTIIKAHQVKNSDAFTKAEKKLDSISFASIGDDRDRLKICISAILVLLTDSSSLISESKILKQDSIAKVLIPSIEKRLNLLIMQVKDKSDDETTFEGLPQLSSPLISGFLVPSITVLGSQSIRKNNSATSFFFKLFFGGSTNTDSTKGVLLNRIILPEASNFGLNIRFIESLNIIQNTKKLYDAGLIFDVNFLSKTFNNSDTVSDKNKKLNTFLFQWKIGFDLVLVDKVLTLYGSVNGICPVTYVDNFYSVINSGKKAIVFPTAGLRADFEVPTDKKNIIQLDLCFVIKNNQLNGLYENNDPLIPFLKVGYKRILK